MSTQYDTNPGSKSPEEVQREVRQSRAEVEQTLDAIQDRLSPGQLFEQAVDYMRGSNGSDFLRNLGARVRDNPIPIVLVGTGLAWLMLSGTRSRRSGYYDEDDALLDEYSEGHYGTGDYPAGYYPGSAGSDEYQEAGVLGETARGQEHRTGGRSYAERAKRTAEAARRRAQQWRAGSQARATSLDEGGDEGSQSWGAGLRETAQEWTSGARSAAAQARERALRLGSGARERLGDTREYLRHGVRGAGQYGRRAQSGFSHLLEEQPLVLGAIGLAVGAAIGAALPKTEVEDEWMGDTRDQLKDRARRMTREQLERARAAGRAAYEAAIEEADRQGWSAEGAMSAAEAAAHKAERVAEAATEAAKAEAQRHGGDQPGSSAPSQVSG
ncbi:MAG TPA: DUF3618 domain-containing protein, partial [Geminicoccaceae bacterium]